jgi:hypothetical protein
LYRRWPKPPLRRCRRPQAIWLLDGVDDANLEADSELALAWDRTHRGRFRRGPAVGLDEPGGAGPPGRTVLVRADPVHRRHHRGTSAATRRCVPGTKRRGRFVTCAYWQDAAAALASMCGAKGVAAVTAAATPEVRAQRYPGRACVADARQKPDNARFAETVTGWRRCSRRRAWAPATCWRPSCRSRLPADHPGTQGLFVN